MCVEGCVCGTEEWCGTAGAEGGCGREGVECVCVEGAFGGRMRMQRGDAEGEVVPRSR